MRQHSFCAKSENFLRFVSVKLSPNCSIKLITPKRGLLNSWATLPANLPKVDSFSEWINCSCVSLTFFSALIRSGQKERDAALKELETLPEVKIEFLEYCKKRLNYSDKEFQKMMDKPIRSYKEFETYIPYFLNNIGLLKDLADKGKLPSTFVEKLLVRQQMMQD